MHRQFGSTKNSKIDLPSPLNFVFVVMGSPCRLNYRMCGFLTENTLSSKFIGCGSSPLLPLYWVIACGSASVLGPLLSTFTERSVGLSYTVS